MTDFSQIRTKAAPLTLFETQIIQCQLQQPESFLADIKHRVLEKMKVDAGVQRSNVGGWHSDTQMLQWGGPAATKLAEIAIGVAKRMSHFDGASSEQYHWHVQMWANVSGNGAANHLHIHPGNIWSGALYVDMGGIDQDDTLGGEFYFEDPRFPTHVMHNTKLRLIGHDGKPQQIYPMFRPRPGDILMFPAWLRHGVHPYKGNGTRISIAFNVDAVLK